MTEYDVSIVIVSWNTIDLLRQCLVSVFHSASLLRLQVIIVDNGSTDGSARMVRTEFPQVQVLENSSNVGFAAANNQALPLCSAKFVLLLNPDAVLLNSALVHLVQYLQQNCVVAAVGPKLVHPRLGLRVLGCGNQPSLWRIVTHYSFLSAIFPNLRAFEGIHLFVGIHDQKEREVEWLSGACLLARKEALIEVGGLCDDWFMYAEDWDLCAQLRSKGWKIMHLPAAVVEHHLSASTEQNALVSTMAISAGRAYFIKLNHPSRISLFIFDCVRTFGLAVRALAYFLFGISQCKSRRRVWFGRAKAFVTYSKAALPRFAANSQTLQCKT